MVKHAVTSDADCVNSALGIPYERGGYQRAVRLVAIHSYQRPDERQAIG